MFTLLNYFCFFAIGEYVRGAARYRPLHLSFGVVRSEPPFMFYSEVHETNKNLDPLDKQLHRPPAHIATFRTQVIQKAHLYEFRSF